MERTHTQHLAKFVRKFSTFTAEALASTDQAGLLQAVSGLLREVFSITSVELMIADGPAPVFRSVGNPSRTLQRSILSGHAGGQGIRPLEVSDAMRWCSPEDRRVLEETKEGLLLPLSAAGGVSALLVLGGSPSGAPSAPGERDLLTVFACGLAIALERNALLEQMKTELTKISKMEKLATLGRLTAGIAHEFRNPLNIISTSAQTILRNPANVDLHVETGGYILEETERLTRTVDEFLQFAKPHTPVWEQVRVSEMLGGAVQGLQDLARAKHIRMDVVTDPSLGPITTSPQHVERVLRNLALNAIEAMPPGGTLTIGAFSHDTESVMLSVSDTGPGIPPEHRARLFDPFFTTKPNGTGLGLAIVFMLVQAVRGSIAFTSSPGGTSFRITLPVDGSRR